MARFTQYIGLTGPASFLVDQLVKIEDSKNYTHGMFDEKIPLGTWIDPYTGTIYLEVAQVTPWSSGPMIFTCLEDKSGNRLFRWTENEKARGHEYFRQEGIYWI